MATGDQNRPSTATTMKDEIKTCSGNVTKKSQVEKITRKQGRLWIVNREGLKVGLVRPFQSKFSIRLLLLVDSKLKNFVAIISQP